MIHIQVTPEAADRLRSLAGDQEAVFKLVYDIDGCGCGVNGVPALWILEPSAKEAGVSFASTNPAEIIYDPQQEVFFEEQMNLRYTAETQALTLSSNGQIYARDIAVVDKRI